ncbi:radical SAM protein [Helicobacter aurati]|uniref:Radical SAM protein n=1 Tax=Helicobacter aurati TaxID=137778 RepID=A0A3D8IZB9_9HELI|nr:radical SAM protein [Helicobacter aurati]RDU70622.1 radical SAM protein [Helicobacter aurati]
MPNIEDVTNRIKAEFRQPYSKDRKPLIELLPLHQPLTMYIDPSNICNFKCSFCFQSNTNAKKEMYLTQMSLETFTTILKQLAEFDNPIKMIHLHGFGEPLLNPHFPLFVKLAKESKVSERIATTSNASLLTRDLSRAIIESGLDQIHFSIYGLNDESYKIFSKKSLRFSQIVENIKYFYEHKTLYAKEYGHNCHVHIKMNKDYFSSQDQVRFLELFGNYADSIYLDGVANIWPGIDVSDSLRLNLSLEEKESTTVSHQYGHSFKHGALCPIVFYQLLVHSNGDISPCCADFQAKMTLGNVANTTLKEIWQQALLQNTRSTINNAPSTKNTHVNTGGGSKSKLALLRASHIKGQKNSLPVCAVCSYPDQAATTSLQEHIHKLKSLYLFPLESPKQSLHASNDLQTTQSCSRNTDNNHADSTNKGIS